MQQESKVPGPSSGRIVGERKRRVLIVDDNIDAGETLRDLLVIFGYEAQFYPRAPLALSCLPQFKPDVCLSDLDMPEMNGYQFAQAVRKDPAFKKIFLIALTSYNWPEYRDAAFDAGFDEHVSKTSDIDALVKVLGTAQFFATEA